MIYFSWLRIILFSAEIFHNLKPFHFVLYLKAFQKIFKPILVWVKKAPNDSRRKYETFISTRRKLGLIEKNILNIISLLP